MCTSQKLVHRKNFVSIFPPCTAAHYLIIEVNKRLQYSKLVNSNMSITCAAYLYNKRKILDNDFKWLASARLFLDDIKLSPLKCFSCYFVVVLLGIWGIGHPESFLHMWISTLRHCFEVQEWFLLLRVNTFKTFKNLKKKYFFWTFLETKKKSYKHHGEACAHWMNDFDIDFGVCLLLLFTQIKVFLLHFFRDAMFVRIFKILFRWTLPALCNSPFIYLIPFVLMLFLKGWPVKSAESKNGAI